MKLIKGEESFYCKQLHLKTEGYISDFKNKMRHTKEKKPVKSINQNDVFDVSLVGLGVFFIINYKPFQIKGVVVMDKIIIKH